jgi:hypothetical protein
MNRQEFLQKINEIIDEEARTTVGILCKRIELLDNKKVAPKFYKELSKEIIYEQSRVLKKLVEYSLIPKITFISRDE